MAKQFHINAKGEPGKCRAFEGNCPYGGRGDHYDSVEQAYKAIEAGQGGAFGPKPLSAADLPSADEYMAKGGSSDDYSDVLGFRAEIASDRQQDHLALLTELKRSKDVTLKRRDKERVARTSDDPATLMAIAERMGFPPTHRKIAAALAANPATPAEVLVEARSRTDMAWNEYVELELHPNYPHTHHTNEGAHAILRERSVDENLAMLRTEPIGDELLYGASFTKELEQGYLKAALSNPLGKFSDGMVSQQVNNHPELAADAARAGKWPTTSDFNNRTYVYSRSSDERGAVQTPAWANAAEAHPDNETLVKIYDRFRNTPEGVGVAKAIFANPAASEETKQYIRNDVKPLIDEYRTALEGLEA